jgi:uncharacterized protein YcbK (DUF882 family)
MDYSRQLSQQNALSFYSRTARRVNARFSALDPSAQTVIDSGVCMAQVSHTMVVVVCGLSLFQASVGAQARQSTGTSVDAAQVAVDATAPGVDSGNAAGRVVAEPSANYAALPELIWRSVNTREVVRARLYLPDGSVDVRVVRQLAHLLRDVPTGRESPVVQRTLKLIVKAAQRFGALEVDVVSAYRTGRSASGRRVRHEGYHSVGSAIDFRFPTFDMAQIAAYARTFAHVGVGYYPESQFVHLDSREQSYFWENRATRGRRGWDRPLARTGADERDRSWTESQDQPFDRGEPVPLVLHPPTAAGASRHRHRRRHHRGHRRHHGHPALRVFGT